MYQITYSPATDVLHVTFPWKEADYGFMMALEGKSPFVKPAPGVLFEALIQPSNWNASLIRKHCVPLAATPQASAKISGLIATPTTSTANIKDMEPTITDWKFYRTPFRHQVIAWKYAVDNPFAALFLDMGLGKTFVTYNVFGYFLGKTNKASLVVIPLSSFETWEREARVCGYPGSVVSVLGSKSRKEKLLMGEGDVFLITYESLKSLLETAKQRLWFYIVLDESTKIKNARAERSKALYELRDKSERRIILSGYPITQSYVDVYGQYRFLDPSIFGTSFNKFRHDYCVMGGWEGRQVVGYTNIKDMTDKMFSRCIRFTKAECLDLPEKMYQVYKFDLNPLERKAYDELKKQLVLRFAPGGTVEKQVTATNALVAGLRLVQICTGYVGGVEPLEGAAVAPMQELGDSKIGVLEEVLDTVPPDENVIIWCRFKHNLQQVAALLTKIGWTHCLFSGELSAEQRKEQIAGFQNGQFRAFVGILQAGGHGLDLTRASYVVYYSQDYSIERRMQSEDRAHRIGQKRSVNYIDIVGRKTVEESILKCLSGKKREGEIVYEFQKDPDKFFSGTADV